MIAGLWLSFGGCARAQSVGTQYVWTGSANSDWTNAANWNSNGVAPTGGTYNARLQIQNGGGSPLIYSADLGHTIYQATNIAGQTPRALLVGNGSRGAMEISGGIFETRGTQADLIGNAAGISALTIDGGEYLSTNSGARTMVVAFGQGGGGGATGVLQITDGKAAVNFIEFGFAATAAGAGIINLDGGTLAAERIRQVSTNALTFSSEINFNGGTLMPLASRTDFMEGLTRANVNTNGAIIDTAGYSITMGQSLLHHSALGATPDGGLTKIGSGSLTLTNASTYDGQTTVRSGVLQIRHDAGLGSSAGGTVVSNGARVELAGGITVAGEAIAINGQGGNNQGALQTVSGSNTWAGQVLLASGVGGAGTRIGAANGGILHVSGQITNVGGAFDLAVRTDSAASRVILSNPNNVYRDTYVVVGTLQLDGGNDRLPTSTVLRLGNGSDVATAAVDLNGVGQRVAGLVSDGTSMPMTVTNTVGATTSRLTIDNAATRNYGGAIGGNIEIVKTGSGMQEFFGASSYAGSTIVSNGTLRVNGEHLGGGAYTVAGGTLGGTGLIDAAIHVLVGGVVAPGNSIGALTVSNTFDLDGTLLIELANSPGPGAGLSDMLDVNGVFDITNGTLEFVYTGTMTNDFYVFAEYDSLSGSPFFDVQNLPTGYTIDYAFGGNQIALVIPEPSAYALALAGCVLGLLLRRRPR